MPQPSGAAVSHRTSWDCGCVVDYIDSFLEDRAVSPEFRDYIVRFQSITDVDNDALQMFAQWMRARQDKGIDIRLCALEPHMHQLLEELSEVGSALMPLDQATNDTARRIVDVRSDRREVPTDEPESTSSATSRTTMTTKHGS
jgi:hypothetical protein